INSSVLALLPQQQETDIPQAFSDGFTQRLDRQLMWLVSPPPGAGIQPAADWLKHLQTLPELSQVQGPMDAQRQQEWGTFF
ncbi:MMPL family transporter, partial [Pseudomonas syringae]|nr:MMPL family transporter [Pseudomonas syringae]